MITSLELVVAAIVLLIVAVVVLGIFSGGIQNFTNIFNTQSDQQIKINLCAAACANYCFLHPDKDSASWSELGGLLPSYKGDPVKCESFIATCNCKKGVQPGAQTPAATPN